MSNSLFTECAICKQRGSGEPPDYFVHTKEGCGQFHFACMRKMGTCLGPKCPQCDETIGFQSLVKRTENMEEERLAKVGNSQKKEILASFRAASGTLNRKSVFEKEIDTEAMENFQLDSDCESHHSDSVHFEETETSTLKKTTKCCCTVA